MKINASLVDIILFIVTIIAGMDSPKKFAVMFTVSTVWFLIHLVFSKKTLKNFRSEVIARYIKGDK